MTAPMDDMIPILDAARMLNASRATVLRWASNGTIEGAVQTGGHRKWFVPRSAVVRVGAEREERAKASKLGPSSWVPMTKRGGQHP